jgi:hypothetical protein
MLYLGRWDGKMEIATMENNNGNISLNIKKTVDIDKYCINKISTFNNSIVINCLNSCFKLYEYYDEKLHCKLKIKNKNIITSQIHNYDLLTSDIHGSIEIYS